MQNACVLYQEILNFITTGLAQGPQRSDAMEAQTRGPTASSQALYHSATALPLTILLSH